MFWCAKKDALADRAAAQKADVRAEAIGAYVTSGNQLRTVAINRWPLACYAYDRGCAARSEAITQKLSFC
jgi:hypothetical protein